MMGTDVTMTRYIIGNVSSAVCFGTARCYISASSWRPPKKREADNPTRPYFSFGESLAMSWIPFINVSERRLACDIKKASCRQRKIDSGRIREIWWEKQPSWKVGGEKKRQLIRDTKEKRRLARIITETRMCNPFPQPAAHRSGASKVSAL